MRTRQIRPDFFKNGTMCELPYLARLLFIGLWVAADREGRLEDKPKFLKRAILPYNDCDVDQVLTLIADALDEDGDPFIDRYEADGKRYIAITKFLEHQFIHPKEAESLIPPPPTTKIL